MSDQAHIKPQSSSLDSLMNYETISNNLKDYFNPSRPMNRGRYWLAGIFFRLPQLIVIRISDRVDGWEITTLSLMLLLILFVPQTLVALRRIKAAMISNWWLYIMLFAAFSAGYLGEESELGGLAQFACIVTGLVIWLAPNKLRLEDYQ